MELLSLFLIPYGFHLKSTEKKTSQEITIKENSGSGDFIEGNKYEQNQQVNISVKQDEVKEDKKKLIKVVRVKINRFLEDYQKAYNKEKEDFYKESNRIANDMASRNIASSGMHIKAQRENAVKYCKEGKRLTDSTKKRN